MDNREILQQLFPEVSLQLTRGSSDGIMQKGTKSLTL
jgi:hypothetical protein